MDFRWCAAGWLVAKPCRAGCRWRRPAIRCPEPEYAVAKFENRLALHTWSLDTTPLAPALTAIKSAGWDAVELRWLDFARCSEQGMTNAQVLDLVRASGLEVAVMGTEYG